MIVCFPFSPPPYLLLLLMLVMVAHLRRRSRTNYYCCCTIYYLNFYLSSLLMLMCVLCVMCYVLWCYLINVVNCYCATYVLWFYSINVHITRVCNESSESNKDLFSRNVLTKARKVCDTKKKLPMQTKKPHKIRASSKTLLVPYTLSYALFTYVHKLERSAFSTSDKICTFNPPQNRIGTISHKQVRLER